MPFQFLNVIDTLHDIHSFTSIPKGKRIQTEVPHQMLLTLS